MNHKHWGQKFTIELKAICYTMDHKNTIHNRKSVECIIHFCCIYKTKIGIENVKPIKTEKIDSMQE